MPLHIDADFDGGNIEVRGVGETGADLAIRPDSNGPWFQWFYFRVTGAARRTLALRIVNAGASAYPGGWPGYQACASIDNETWTRAATTFEQGVLTITYPAEADTVWFAFFAPYDLARHQAFLDRAAAAPGVTVAEIGRSVDGRSLHQVTLGSGPKPVWVIGRQHSGETMASWCMEGALDCLLSPADPVGSALLKAATVHLAPLVNIDGAARGNLRGNAAGIDLNRQWHGPDPAKAPEVAAVLAAIDKTGCVLSLDVHGDETLPHVFVDGCDQDPAATAAQIAGVRRFEAALLKASPAFQTQVGYPPTYGGDAAAGMCNRALGRRFGAIGLTLEMPFHDSLEAPDPVAGWSPAACRAMGRASLQAILETIADL
jgi:murein tripeptide amidase MpaA